MASDLSLPLAGAAPGRRSPLRRRALSIALAAIVLFISYVIFIQLTSLRRYGNAPPSDQLLARAFEQRAAQTYLGESWIAKDRGLWELHLEGAPYAIGLSEARLGESAIRAVDSSLTEAILGHLSSPLDRLDWLTRIRWRHRSLPRALSEDVRIELTGIADALDEGSSGVASPLFSTHHRLVLAQVFDDVAASVATAADRDALLGGPAFVSGKVVGRSFDTHGDATLARERAVIFYRSRDKVAFASVGWIGQVGVTTGVSAEGIFAATNAARTDEGTTSAVSPQLVVRAILEGTRSIDEAIAYIKKTSTGRSALYLLADGKTGESAIVEQSPSRVDVRRVAPPSKDPQFIVHHAMSTMLAADPENDRVRRYTPSGARARRLSELLAHYRGALDPKRALEVLRDRRAQGGARLALLHPSAVDPLTSAYGAIVDLSAMTLWVSAGENLGGRFVGFDLRRELLGEDRPHPADLPVDSTLDGDELARARDAQIALMQARAWRGLGEDERAFREVSRAIALLADAPDPHRLLGDLLRARGDKEGARREYQRFIDLAPASLRELEEVRGLVGTL